MTKEKKDRLIVAGTVGSVLLLVVLLVVLIYQMITYSSVRKQKADLEARKAYLTEKVISEEQDLENRKRAWEMEMSARRYGLAFPEETQYEAK